MQLQQCNTQTITSNVPCRTRVLCKSQMLEYGFSGQVQKPLVTEHPVIFSFSKVDNQQEATVAPI